jgi:chromosome segregation ATPase
VLGPPYILCDNQTPELARWRRLQMPARSGSVVSREREEAMDDNFTTGPKDDQSPVTLTSLDKRLRTIQDDLRAMVLERRELSVTLMEMNRSIQRRGLTEPELSADKQALLGLRRDYASVWEMYANLQQRMDRLDDRIRKIEEKLEPPLPPFPEFKPKP